MPTFKHPCPYCDKFIDRAVAACPYCGQADPFAPKRCLNCRKIVEDPAWITCPSCGNSLVALPPPAGTPTAAAGAASPGSSTTATAPNASVPGTPAAQAALPPPRPPLNADAAPVALKSVGPCGGCGAPLPAGARFCTICGTVAG